MHAHAMIGIDYDQLLKTQTSSTLLAAHFVCANWMWSTDLNYFHLFMKLMLVLSSRYLQHRTTEMSTGQPCPSTHVGGSFIHDINMHTMNSW